MARACRNRRYLIALDGSIDASIDRNTRRNAAASQSATARSPCRTIPWR
jgi:hypothetical protein